MQQFCRVRVFCSDREPPGDVDVVPVHGRRQYFDAAMPLLVELGFLSSGLNGVLWLAISNIVQLRRCRVAVVVTPRVASEFVSQ